MTNPTYHITQLRAKLASTDAADERAELERQIAELEAQLDSRGDQRNIHTGGGDYIAGDVDNRQGTFVAGDQYNINQTSTPSITEWRHKLTLKLCDHSHTMSTRLVSFVGRRIEVAALQALIDQSIATGGYVVITGQAGQGKSSIIAHLIVHSRDTKVVHHLIPSNPVSGYEIVLLRDLIAQLALKHELVDVTLDSDSLPVLTQEFKRVMQRIVEQGHQEIIFIDALDQLFTDGRLHTLNFLPRQLRSGIVTVLATRSDGMLRSLAPLAPMCWYNLPSLSRDDFIALLRQHDVSLPFSAVDQLHTALRGHALYLELAARLLTEEDAPDIAQIVERVDADPEGLFSLSIERLCRYSDWQDTVKPLLAFLTVARAPISHSALKKLAAYDFERVRLAMERLGGLIEYDASDRVALYHAKLRAFLTSSIADQRTPFDTDDLRTSHARFANWGLTEDKSTESTWPDPERERYEAERQHYAKDHLPAHVFLARDEQLLARLLTVDLTQDAEVVRLEHILRALQQETETRVDEGAYLLLTHVLPLGVGPLSTDPSTQGAATHVRRAFRHWLDQYPEADRVRIRASALDQLHERLVHAPTPGACWLVSALGFRRDDITALLWTIAAQYDNEIGDSALAALAHTRAAQGMVEHFVALLGDRGARRWNTALRAAYRQHTDTQLIDVIRRRWLSAGNDALPTFERIAVLDVLVAAAERDPSGRMADAIWNLLYEQAVRDPDEYIPLLRLGSGIAGKCDTPQVIPSMLSFLAQESEHGERHRELIYRRLADCIRPRQLTGWEQSIPSTIRAIIQADACADSQTQGRWLTIDIDVKLFAWETALCLNFDNLLDWVEPTLIAERNPAVVRPLTYRLGCLELPVLPRIVQQWLTEPCDKRMHTPEEWSRRIAAIRIAHSSPSPSSFAALLTCALHMDEAGLQQTADALSDVAYVLARRDDVTVVEQLLTTYRESPYPYQRSAAAQALAALAAKGFVSGQALLDLIDTLDDEQRTPLERGYIVAVWGCAHELALPLDLINRCVQWGRERSEQWLSVFAVEALARRGDVVSYPDLMAKWLYLQREDDRWVFRPNQGERDTNAAHFMCLLYERAPDAYAELLATWITDGEWYHAEPIVEYLTVQKRAKGTSVSNDVQTALITRVMQRQRRDYTEREIIQNLDVLAPELLLHTDWSACWNTWWYLARAALADAISRAARSFPNRTARAVALLERLVHDPEYEVRRAAMRAWVRCAPDTLGETGLLWATMTDTSARLRAAELLAWLPPTDATAGILATRLADDPEAAIRHAVETALKERQEHTWGTDYLARVKAFVLSGQTHIASVYRYGAALIKVGDDETVRALHQLANQPDVLLHVRYWLQRLISKLEERWKTQVASWKGRWVPVLESVVEEEEGLLMHPSGVQRHTRYRVWRRATPSVSAIPSWGGIMTPEEECMLWESSLSMTLRFADGREGKVWVPSCMGSSLEFVGESLYPYQRTEPSS